MSKLWQLKKLSTNEALNEPQLLPENWGPIFGLNGIKEKIGDLSWLGEPYTDCGWIEVGDIPPDPVPEQPSALEIVKNRVKKELQESDWAVLPDVPMISSKKVEWLEYRRALREVELQAGFPNEIHWPIKPV